MTQRVRFTIPAQTIEVEIPGDPQQQQQLDDHEQRISALEDEEPIPPQSPIRPEDVIYGFDASKTLSQQVPALSYEAAGQNYASASAPDVISYKGSPRVSIVADPVAPTRNVLRVSQLPTDPVLFGQPRTELCYLANTPGELPLKTDIWRVWQSYFDPWNANSATTLVAQVHWTQGQNPSIQTNIKGNQWRTELRYKKSDGNQVLAYSNTHGPAVASRVWITHVQAMRLDPNGDGYFRYWIDGEQKVNYSGALGYVQGDNFPKFGLYPLDSPVGQVHLIRGHYWVRDNDYTEDDLADFIKAQ